MENKSDKGEVNQWKLTKVQRIVMTQLFRERERYIRKSAWRSRDWYEIIDLSLNTVEYVTGRTFKALFEKGFLTPTKEYQTFAPNYDRMKDFPDTNRHKGFTGPTTLTTPTV